QPHLPYTLSLHDALPISKMSPHVCSVEPSTRSRNSRMLGSSVDWPDATLCRGALLGSMPPPPPLRPPSEVRMKYPMTRTTTPPRSEEHTSELQSRGHLVC